MAPKIKKGFVQIKEQNIPVFIHSENRRNTRVAIGMKGLIIRVPSFFNDSDISQTVSWAKNWAESKAMIKDLDLQTKFKGKNYQSGDSIVLYGRTFHLEIDFKPKSTHSAKLKNGVIFLELAQEENPDTVNLKIRTLISRIVASNLTPIFTNRVLELNQLHFKKTISAVRLRYSQSNWGSCSNKGKLNFSTRLLLAPVEVIDYVIIHELAHLIELNHSPRFWKLVEDAMPDYKSKEKWLSTYGEECHF
jgi:predicted metal-dependent hydrolase